MPGTVQTGFGKIVLEDDVIASIAGYATLENYGIVGMASKNASDGLWQLIGRDNIRKGVRVTTTEDQLVIDLFVMVQYGVSINAVAENIIHNVGYRIQDTTGLMVTAVNVHVEGVRVLNEQG